MQDKAINITLPVNAVNAVLNALAQRPYAEVAQLIAEIKQQAEKQLEEKPIEPAE